MIQVHRGPEPPKLSEIRERELQRVSQAVERGESVDSELIGTAYSGDDNGIKHHLRALQGGKCCYCEKAVGAAYNDVEHYRPKCARLEGAPNGYWWLAWTWENLLFACASCNRSAKRDTFELVDPTTRLKPGDKPPGSERPRLIDPGAEDPMLAMTFFQDSNERWRPIPVEHDVRGAYSIELLKLDRDELADWYNAINRLDLPPLRRAYATARDQPSEKTESACQELFWSFMDKQRPFLHLRYVMAASIATAAEWAEVGCDLARPCTGTPP